MAWSPLEGEKLLSGSDDKRIILFNVEAPGEGSVWNASEGVEDVKWSYFNQNIFASAQQDEKICLYILSKSGGIPGVGRISQASVGRRTQERCTLLTLIKNRITFCFRGEKIAILTFGT